MNRNKFLCAAICLSLITVQHALAQQADIVPATTDSPMPALSETQKIERLISYISNLKGATFIRNGNKYSPQEAANHLASKFKKYANKIRTAHDFIDNLASKSSASGELYQIRLADGTLTETQKLLNTELQRIEMQAFRK